jgi:putative FmdB family regulatory protein
MPTYEYVCTDCKNEWEEVQKISEPALDACPKCGKATAKRQISGGNFILKGGGWYADLYSSTPKAKGGEGKSEGASTTAATGKSDSGGSGTAAPAAGTGSSGASGGSGASGASGGSGSSGSSGGSSGSSGGSGGGGSSSGSGGSSTPTSK